MSKSVIIQFEFDDSEKFIEEGIDQIAQRRKKGKRERTGVKVNDRSLVKKLQAKEGVKRVELIRVHCHSGFGTTMMAIKAIYRSYNKDGTVRETAGDKHYFEQGHLSFKRTSEDTTKLSFERDGIIVKASNQQGKKGKVSPSMRICFLRC
ncbi:expressed unknown protein [Seminavis robusta]|uniref:Uncharacterized protein n=1 Tax=Seminavis robusta TaxID=568900 RepID=A0A9N8HQ14_9STRA|nr:expressed unknown protein [Seminavis robusta]|eukprot:Sro1125_g243882.1  (150) ;mRNA; f:9816-10265